jgi:hypothetical protein
MEKARGSESGAVCDTELVRACTGFYWIHSLRNPVVLWELKKLFEVLQAQAEETSNFKAPNISPSSPFCFLRHKIAVAYAELVGIFLPPYDGTPWRSGRGLPQSLKKYQRPRRYILVAQFIYG